MPSPLRIRPRLRALGMRAIRQLQHRALRVQVREHTDPRGRTTPVLDVGVARRGTLVWLHGFSDRFDSILQVAPHLRSDWRIVSPSMPAFGEGWVDASELHTFDAYAAWMSALLTDLVDSAVLPPQFHLMGNSLGGATALGVTARVPELVKSVVALNAAGVRLDDVRCAQEEIADGHNLFRIEAREDYERLQGRIFAHRPKIPAWIGQHLFEEMRRHADWYTRLGEDMAKSEVRAEGDGWHALVPLHEVTRPTLVLWGAEDGLFPVAHGERMAASVVNGRLETLPNIGHAAHVERPKALAEAFRRWAASQS
ncbi:MAG: alpha/beta fold hydrolase [Sandaracinaceae bacterium]